MQKAYSRINWKDEPSLDTPLGANNLNKMDSALDVIDNRVLSLSGYEGRVQASEKNAKSSEVNAKTSENNAKESEELAREYAERAFNTTPEGYEQIVDTVQKMDIKESADTTLLDSKAGGYKLLSMSGNSVQNGTPTPDAPQSIHNVGDCVEMIKGAQLASNGEWSNLENYICSKNPIKCKSGDVVKIVTETVGKIFILYYGESGYISNEQVNDTKVLEKTIPNGVTHFNFSYNYAGVTPSTVGKISLTINGKYVVQIPEENKNLWEWGDVSGINEIVKKYKSLPIGTYTLSYVTSATSGNMNVQIGDANGSYLINKSTQLANFNTRNSVTFTITSQAEFIRFYSDTQTEVTSIQLERGEVATEWEEHKEKVATVLLNAPLRDTDVMSRTEVVRNRVVKKASELSWGASTNNPHLFVTASFTSDCVCTHFTDTKDSRINGDYYANMYLASGQCSKRHGIVDRVYFKLDSVSALEEWKTWIAENDFLIEYDLPEEVIETLDTDSQIALNSLETFDSVTYINVDSRVQPKGIKGEYGTSKVGARTIKNELKNDTLEIKYNELAVALVATESGV